MCSNCGTGEREWLAGGLAELSFFEGEGRKVFKEILWEGVQIFRRSGRGC